MKFPKKPNIMHDLFVKNVKVISEAFTEIQATVQAFCKQDASGLKIHANKVIELENQSDKIREEIVQRLFTKESMVFSRPDRLDIVDLLDKVGDATEVVVQRLTLYNPTPKQEFASKLNNYAKKIGSLGVELENLIIYVFQDFSQTFPIIDKIQLFREEIRKDQWALLKQNYEVHTHPLEFFYYQSVIKDICRVADLTEELADFIRGLLCKYA